CNRWALEEFAVRLDHRPHPGTLLRVAQDVPVGVQLVAPVRDRLGLAPLAPQLADSAAVAQAEPGVTLAVAGPEPGPAVRHLGQVVDVLAADRNTDKEHTEAGQPLAYASPTTARCSGVRTTGGCLRDSRLCRSRSAYAPGGGELW